MTSDIPSHLLRHISCFCDVKTTNYGSGVTLTPTNTPTRGLDFAGVLGNTLAIILSSPIPHLTRRYENYGRSGPRAHAQAELPAVCESAIAGGLNR